MRNLLKEVRENSKIQNAIGFVSRAVKKLSANVFDAIALERMANNAKESINLRLRSSKFENCDFSVQLIGGTEKIITSCFAPVVSQLNMLMTQNEIIIQRKGGIPSCQQKTAFCIKVLAA